MTEQKSGDNLEQALKQPVVKWALKAPIYLYRMGLGRIIGQYIILITHTGRKSGLPRRTLTEFHIAENGKKYVPSGFGAKAQWYKNIMADPRVTLQSKDGIEHMRGYRVTDDAELLMVHGLIGRRNPVMWTAYLENRGVENSNTGIIAGKDEIFVLGFDSTDEATPPPQEVDLWWLWLIPAVIMLVLLRLGKHQEE